MGESGHGTFMLTKGGATDIAFLEDMAAKSGRPGLIAALFHNPTNPNKVFDGLSEIRTARERGNKIYAQVSAMPIIENFTIKFVYMFAPLRSWQPALREDGDERVLRALLSNPSFRAAVKNDLEKTVGSQAFGGQWHDVTVAEVAREENGRFVRRSIGDLAAEDGTHPLDAMLDLALSDDLGTEFTVKLLNSDESAVGRILRDSDNYIALSDAGAHLSLFCNAGFGAYLLGRWSRELQVLTLEEAVYRTSGHAAALFGITDRGRLAPGAMADLLLFDPSAIRLGPMRRVSDFPGGGSRLVTPAIGIHGVWVNGSKIADDRGVIKSNGLPGAVLRRFES
jgi:N-acyl-D-aspartate/D-glutamate deacylase